MMKRAMIEILTQEHDYNGEFSRYTSGQAMW